MKTEYLLFNGERVDLPPGVQISSNYQIATFENLENRQISFTNTLTIPRTEKFIKILNGYGIESANSNVPYRINKITYFRNDVLQFENASAIIKSFDSSFKINIYFQNNSLFEAIDGLNLSDLNFTNLNHRLNVSNYTSLLTDGVLSYPIANFGTQTDEEIVFEYQIPAIKTSYLWNKIFADNGFQYIYKGRGNKPDFNPFISEEWLDGKITLNEGIKDQTVEDDEGLENVSITGQIIETFDFSEYFDTVPTIGIIWNLPPRFTRPINFSTQIIDSNIFGQFINGRRYFDVRSDNYYNIKFSGSTVTDEIQTATIKLVKNGIPFADIAEIEQGVSQIDFEQRFYFTSNDIFEFQVLFENDESNQAIELSIDFNLIVQVDNQFKNINLNEYFKDLSQKDFIKSMANKFGLIFVQKGLVYEFISVKELFTPFANYESFNALQPVNFVFDDWSSKFDSLIEQKTKLSNSWSRRNKLVYKYVNENDDFANTEIIIEDETLKPEDEILKSKFYAPTNSNIRIGNSRLKRIPLYEVEDEGVKAEKIGPFFITTEKKNGSFNYKQIGGSTRTYNGEFQIANFQGISFTELRSNWLQSLGAILTKTEKISANIALTEIDIAKNDWFKLKFIKQLGGFYYLNKINNFTGDQTTKCELVKVRPFEQIGEFNDDYNDDFNN